MKNQRQMVSSEMREWMKSVQFILETLRDTMDVWNGPPEGPAATRDRIRNQVAERLFCQALDCAGPSLPQRLVGDDEVVQLSEWCWHVAAIHADIMPEIREAARVDGLLEILGDPPRPHRAVAAEPTLPAEAGVEGLDLDRLS